MGAYQGYTTTMSGHKQPTDGSRSPFGSQDNQYNHNGKYKGTRYYDQNGNAKYDIHYDHKHNGVSPHKHFDSIGPNRSDGGGVGLLERLLRWICEWR
jgi:hypothetical protein